MWRLRGWIGLAACLALAAPLRAQSGPSPAPYSSPQAWQTAAAAPPGEAALPALIPTRQTEFQIPFRVDTSVQGPLAPLEAWLYVSSDAGATWHVYQKTPPHEQKFVFKAPRDGQYWFTIRTLARSGQTLPNRTLGPDMRVLVDTVAPQLALEADRGEAGEVRARWRVADPHLQPDTLSLSYQTVTPESPWQAIAIDPLQRDPAGHYDGHATWWPEQSGAAIRVRAEIIDLAGNRATAVAEVADAANPLDQLAHNQFRQSSSPVSEPAAESALDTATSAPPQAGPQQQPHAPPVASNWTAQSSGPLDVAGETFSPASQGPLPARFPAASAPATAFSVGPGSSPAFSPPRYADDRATEIVPPGRPAKVIEPSAFGPALPGQTSVGGEEAIGPGQRHSAGSGPAAPFQGELLPPGIRPRMVNSRRFELDYDVESVGPSGIARIELWGTRDGGQTWYDLGPDDDNRSPYLVSVDDDGLYGFRMVVESGSGLRTPRPRSGELPDVWVGVDLSPPEASLVEVSQGTGEQAGELVIRWQASDHLLAERPVSVAFSTSPRGPWSTIATGLPNSGQYRWRLDNRVPDQVYIQLEVRDEAGNISHVTTPDPVAMDRVRPKGLIRSVRPLAAQ